ncbi:hypothetical protein [Dyella nitratireducens]|uniref:ABC transmembrane type-1 domain-containing protein n=1 Tax=Dyella nitratireducens TaxID=1849580 RepID=A0ABQ1FWX8_9GAMM|nr:hypothetical protein [Dyella nitratireducens]GGA31194.1 hypothetical protein GCM10010981_20310 [Dyella nitratireducens]GLQ42906.1 hypothetical protein GCM10007902_27560 [Dyella nitratireducens]
MDQRVDLFADHQDIDVVKEIVKRLTIRKRSKRPQATWIAHVENAEKLVRTLAMTGLAVCVILGLLSRTFDSYPLAETMLVMSLLVILLFLAMLISPIVVSVPFFRTMYKNPFVSLLENLDDASSLDLPMVLELMRCKREAVEYVLTHYRHQRLAFEKRGMMLAGSLDKIGFFPTLVAFAMLMIPAWAHLDRRIQDFALLVPVFHFINLLSYGLNQEMDRVISLLEYSIAARDRIDKLLR